ncbi:prolipoprotein diacylglyceryl transferase [Patescibacteria group bacterium]|nr:prolipoprotein diacylglyceryl transferase [Patescibacteria group bacterium]MBU1256104.1 prolipoprotein diacylglyceryl transferase [Patescibacteria group bacterium]MBU1457233.1 prolipoprotein diacylglyceryl transferase [Patescibacteria group bacterium]
MISFHWYGFLIGVAILSALQVSIVYAKRVGIKKELIEKAFWWVLVGGIIGARAYHVVDLWQEYYRFNYLKSLFLWEGGLGIWGAIIGGIVGLLLFCRLNKKGFSKLIDIAVIGVPLGQAIGRLGNWVNGELYGKNGEPLFAWEAGLNLLLFIFLWRIGKKEKATGKIAGSYLIGYGLIRILLENLRPEEIIWKWQGVPVAIIFGIFAVFIGGTILRKRKLS